MDARYLEQVRLLLRWLPALPAADCFALKGGTAINPAGNVEILRRSGRSTARLPGRSRTCWCMPICWRSAMPAALRPRRRCMTASSLDLSSRRELGLLADLVQATRDLLHCIQTTRA